MNLKTQIYFEESLLSATDHFSPNRLTNCSFSIVSTSARILSRVLETDFDKFSSLTFAIPSTSTDISIV